MFERVNEMGRGRARLESKTSMKRANAIVKKVLCEMNHNEVGQADANAALAHQVSGEDYLGLGPIRMMDATLATG